MWRRLKLASEINQFVKWSSWVCLLLRLAEQGVILLQWMNFEVLLLWNLQDKPAEEKAADSSESVSRLDAVQDHEGIV